ncbi:MAG: hypothetical protein E6K17_06190 [Methanobacteriota archaeon]|nr:MAG: hypothetical protein E6K17_06190 [Euryarchaeota archaeon]
MGRPDEVSSLLAMRRFALLAAATLLVSPMLAMASGDSDGDGIPDDLEAATARNVFVQGSSSGFVIRSRSIGASPEDAFAIAFSDGNFTVQYFPISSGQATVSYQLAFRRILEVYLENGEWKEENRTELSWNYASARQSEVRTTDGETEVLYSVTSASRTVTVTVGSTNRFARVGGNRLLSPMEVTVDVLIRGWNYTRANSQLALQVEINGTGVPRVDETSDDETAGWAMNESSVKVSSLQDSLFFAWDRMATVDGVPTPVDTTPLEPSPDGVGMSFVYGRGNVIVHDPKIGAVSNAFWSIWSRPTTTAPAFDATIYVLGIAVAAGLVGVTVFLRRRRRTE